MSEQLAWRFRQVAALTPYPVERMHLNDAADEITRLTTELAEAVAMVNEMDAADLDMHMERVDAAKALSEASGHTMDDAILVVAALENSGVRLVRTSDVPGAPKILCRICLGEHPKLRATGLSGFDLVCDRCWGRAFLKETGDV